MTIVNDAPSCGITYEHHSDDSRGVIFALRAVNYALRGVTHDDRHMTIKICLQYKPQVTKFEGDFSQKC